MCTCRSNRPLPDLEPNIHVALGVRSGRRRRFLAGGKIHSDSVAGDSDSDLRGFQFSRFRLHFRFQIHRQWQPVLVLHAGLQPRRVVALERAAGAHNGGFDERGVLLAVQEGGDGAIADVDVAGEYSDGGGVVGEEDLLVGIGGGDCDVEAGVKGGGGGEVQVREFQRGHGEGRAVGAVEQVERSAGDADQEE